MIVEGVFRSEKGWTSNVLAKFVDLEGVLRVDGQAVRPDCTFEFAHVFFANEEVAKSYMNALAEAAGTTVQRLI